MPRSILPAAQSAELRNRLIAEIVDIASSEQAEDWARQALPTKNTLAVADAQAIEQAFERRLIELGAIAEGEPAVAWRQQGRAEPQGQGDAPTKIGEPRVPEELGERKAQGATSLGSGVVDAAAAIVREEPAPGIDKSLLALAEPKRHRNKEHLRFVARQPCLVCGRTPSDPHHLRFAQARALGRKVSDEFAVPLCRSHHRALHRVGNEQGWWQSAGIDALEIASKLWGQSRLIEQAEPTDAPARSEPLGRAADPRPGSTPPSPAALQIARRDRSRTKPGITKRGVQAPATGRLPS